MKAKGPAKRESMAVYAFRLPESLIADVDRFAAEQEAERPGMRVTRADAVRALVLRGLAGVGPSRGGRST